MCGINGYLQFNTRLSKEKIHDLIHLMNDQIIHRGPDDEGLFIDDHVGLGMRRLSIIDLVTGNQPIFNEDKSIVIILNGEIYNYKTLKKDLLEKGHVFATTTDTEVILHCYEEYGQAFLSKIVGMYSFAIYNLKTGKIILARDRAGEKPLYYYKDQEIFLFASEIKSILASKLVNKNICREALNQYLQLTYIPAPLTIYEQIYKLLPGNYMEIDSAGNVINEKYWDVSYESSEQINDYNVCKKRLRDTLYHAVEETMVSDVPIGAYLSGGIDSSAIVGMMSIISNKPIDTFTIGYKNKQYDESKRAKIVSEFNKTNHHIYYLDYNDIFPELNTIIANMDEPFADSSLLPTYMISKYARKYVKTVLTGDAGDELFGGYEKYLIGYYAQRYNNIPKFLRQNVINKIAYSLPDKTSLTRKLRKVIDNAKEDIYVQRRNLMCLGFKKHEMESLLNDNFIFENSTDFINQYYTQYSDLTDEMTRALYTDFKVVLDGDMLTKVDRASMLNSIETRVPMLHKNVVELAAKIPSNFKIDANNKKIILKDAVTEFIPNEIINLSKKGFGVPISIWLAKELKNELLSVLNKKRIEEQGIFKYSYIEKIMEEHFTSVRNRASELWTLYIFQKWYENYFL